MDKTFLTFIEITTFQKLIAIQLFNNPSWFNAHFRHTTVGFGATVNANLNVKIVYIEGYIECYIHFLICV